MTRKQTIAAVVAAVAVFLIAFVILQTRRSGGGHAENPAAAAPPSSSSVQYTVRSGPQAQPGYSRPPTITPPATTATAATSPSAPSSSSEEPPAGPTGRDTATSANIITTGAPIPPQRPTAATPTHGAPMTPVITQTSVAPAAADMRNVADVVTGFIETNYTVASSDSADYNSATRSAGFTTPALHQQLVQMAADQGPWAGFGTLHAALTSAAPFPGTKPSATEFSVAVTYYTYLQPAGKPAQVIANAAVSVRVVQLPDRTWRVSKIISAAG